MLLKKLKSIHKFYEAEVPIFNKTADNLYIN